MGCSSGTVVREAQVPEQNHISTASSSTASKPQQVPASLPHDLATSGSTMLRVASADADAPAPPPMTPEEPLPPPVTARPPSAAARDGLTSPGGTTPARTSSGFVEANLAHASSGGLADVAKSGMVLTASTAFTSPRHFEELPFPPRPSDPTSGSSTPTPPDTILGRQRSNPASAYPCLNSPRPFDEAHFPPRSAGSSTSARVTTQSFCLGGLVTMAEEDILDLFDDQEASEDQFTRVEIQGLMSKLLDDAFEGATNEKAGTSASSRRQNQSLSLSTEDEQIMQEILEDLD